MLVTGRTVEHDLFCEVVHITAPLHVLSEIQITAAWAQQICYGLIVDLQEAALHTEPQLVPALRYIRTTHMEGQNVPQVQIPSS